MMADAGPRTADRQRRQQRQVQRRWIQLIDAWTHAPAERVELLEQITHHSQVIVKTVRDRAWLLVAFQMAVSAVLFPEDDSAVAEDAPQLGQQLLQLAIHSVCSHGADEARAAFEQLAARLAVYETLGELTEMLALPPLPLTLVLAQDAAALLTNLAVLPQAADLLPPLLRRHPALIAASAPARLPILAQLIRSSNAHTLAASGLLIAWNGSEVSIWSKTPLDLDTLTRFYADQVAALCEIGCDADARALCTVLRAELQGTDGQAAAQRIEAALSSSALPSAGASNAVLDIARIKALAQTVPPLTDSSEKRTQAAATTLAQLTPSNPAADLVQLIDVGDSAALRAHVLSMVAQASLPPALFVAVLYARPAAGSFRIDVNCPPALLTQFITTARAKRSPAADSALSTLLRAALDADTACIVPACQLYARGAGSVDEALRHLTWLAALAKLMDAASAQSDVLDVCWLAAYGGASASDKQEQALGQLVETFSVAFPASRPGLDVASLRVKAAWTTFFTDALALCGRADVPFGAVTPSRAVALLLSGVLRTGDVDLFRTLAVEPSVTQALTPEEVESLVLAVSTELYDRASVGSMRNPEMRMASDVLDGVAGASGRVQAQRAFIEASCRLCSFKVKSREHPGSLMEPREIRATVDRMELVGRLLATQEDAYRSPELVLEIATKLSGGLTSAPRTLVEVRTLAMLADSATASADFDDAAAFCHRLVDKVSILRTRAATSELLTSAVELGWKSCYQLSKHPGWDDTPSRITMLAHALTLCPAAQLQPLLKQWSLLDQQLVGELEQGKQFASTRKAAAGWLSIGAAAGPQQNAAATAASVGAGLVGMGSAAANLLPLSFSPLAYFNPPQHDADNRAARLFDFDQPHNPDPTERAVRAARAARDFLGWKSSQQQPEQPRTGFSLSKGVGWLIGEDKH